MAKKRRERDAEAWKHAKKLCRLNARQVEMARALGMNPRKLPGLRPSAQERWKLPVGAFIEESYWKRFGRPPEWEVPGPRARKPRTAHPTEPTPARPPELEAQAQAQALVCYLLNLADDLQRWLAHASDFDADVLSQVSTELREVTEALDTGTPVPEVPEIPIPPLPTRAASSRRHDEEREFDDDIPF